MKHTENDPQSPTLSFSGAAALLLLVAAFCAYPLGAYTPASIFAGLAFVALSFSAPDATPAPVRVRARRPSGRVSHPNRDKS